MPSNAQLGGHFQLVIFDGPLDVNWNVGPLSPAWRSLSRVPLVDRADIAEAEPPHLSAEERRAQCQDRLTFLWVMATIAIKYIARGQTQRAVGQVGLVHAAFHPRGGYWSPATARWAA